MEDDITRTRLSRCRGRMLSEKISAGIYRIGKEWSSTTRTFGDAPAQKCHSGLGQDLDVI